VRIATFTVTRNETVFLPVWVRNSLRNFKPEDIYILDHQSEDSSVKDAVSLGCKSETIFPPGNPSADWFRERVKQKQVELLRDYDWVLFAESDELILPRSGLSMQDLCNDLQSRRIDIVRCSGVDIVHDYKNEAHIDFSPGSDLLANRSNCVIYFTPGNEVIPNPKMRYTYSKPNLSRKPTNWANGFHRLDSEISFRKPNEPFVEISPDLFLVHCHYLDLKETDRRRRMKVGSTFHLDGAALELDEALLDRFDEMLSMSCEIPQQVRDLRLTV
jgi:hypothetical protein